MKISQLAILTFAASLFVLSAGCELIVNFDRDKIDLPDSAVVDSGRPDACDDCTDAGPDATDEDAGSMDATVPIDSGTDADVTIDSGMDAANDEDSGV